MTKKKSSGTRYFGKPLTDDPDDVPELLRAFSRDGELRHGDKLIRRHRDATRLEARHGRCSKQGRPDQT
jgi:hypothetical protein